MLRMHTIASAKAALAYYNKSDASSGYYLGDPSLGCEWLGEGAGLLGLDGRPDYEQFKNLIYALDPHTGNPLTGKPRDERSIPGWDITASVPKGVTTVLEMGDDRVQEVIRRAKNRAFADLEQYATTRVRKGGEQADRRTHNLVAFSVEHPETRPNKDGMPDWDRHWHTVVFNLTFDPKEKEWKAVKFRPVMELRKYFDRRFDMYVARGMTELGYEVETRQKAGRYYSWDIRGIPQTVLAKFSRRSAEVEKLAEEMKVATPVGKDKLGATSRANKRQDLTLEDYRRYWQSRITPKEGEQVAAAIASARAGENPLLLNTPDLAARYAIGHHFERSSVVPTKELEITAMERSMGAALPDEMLPELKRQGLLTRGEESTTGEVLEEEGRIIAFAREGKGTMRPLALQTNGGLTLGERSKQGDHATLSPEQQAVCRHVWESADRVILIRGAAGTGKTTAMKTAIAGIDRPVAVLAPSADASRGVLRREGFGEADTVRSFLDSAQRRAGVRNGVIWVDEAGLLPIKDLSALTDVAREQNARVVLQGDPKQHRSVARDGNMMETLRQFAGLPVAELRDIRRQKGKYREAVKAVERGDILKGHDILSELGYIRETPVWDHNKPIIGDYLEAVDSGKSALVIAPTHAEKDEITAEIRTRLRQEGRLGEEREFEALTPLAWTGAQKGDAASYSGEEVIQFHRASGPFKAGERVAADIVLASEYALRPGHFSVYAHGHCRIAAGDTVRITANGWSLADKGRKHRLNNGTIATVAGFTEGGDIRLANGWEVGRKFGHITHGYVSTSFAAQGKTVDRVLIAMGHESRPAINAAQFYVSVSRGRERAAIYTSLSPATLREAIQKTDTRKSATELMTPDIKRLFYRRRLELYRRLREQQERAITERTRGYYEQAR